ncbi:MAG: UvrD-helicase domain-containing protein, partial [Oscillospiraceae bacterium]
MLDELQSEFIALRKQYIENKFKRLNPMQRQAVYQTKGPLLILAGAGSGKTSVLVNRVANMVLFGDAANSEEINGAVTDNDIAEMQQLLVGMQKEPSDNMRTLLAVDAVKPYNILAITFTNKAAGELKNRLEAMLGDAGRDINASTFHSCCVRILRREAENLGYPKAFTIYDSDDSTRAMKEVYKLLSIDDKFLPVKGALSSIGRLKDKMIDPEQAKKDANEPRAEMVAKVYEAYAKRLKKAGAMDFDDLIYNTVHLFEQFDDVRDHYQNLFKYILVDEYQDTSIAQFKLVDILGAKNKNVCVVGDDDQSIYRFR